MASTTGTPTLRATTLTATATATATAPVGLASLCLGGGLLLAANSLQRFLHLGADTPYITHLLALNAPVTSEVGGALGPAGDSVDNLVFVLALLGSAVAAILLLLAGGFWLSSARARHPEAARRVSAVGLWMALVLAVVGMLPVNGTWQDAGLGGSGTIWFGTEAQLATVAVLGLIMLKVSAPQWRASLREAFRG